MPQATTTLGTIIARCQNRVGDTTTEIWDGTTFDGGGWSNAINDSIVEILADLYSDNALELFTQLHASTAITMVADTESYNYETAISGDSKTYFAFIKAMWGDYNVRVVPFHVYEQMLDDGAMIATDDRPFMTFWGDGTFLLRPKPAGATPTFTFYYVQIPTELDATGEKPDLNEKCVPLIYPKACGKYWQRRRHYERWQMCEAEYERLYKKIVRPHKHGKRYSIISTDRN